MIPPDAQYRDVEFIVEYRKRPDGFHLFGGECYYPQGGVGDHLGTYKSVELAMQVAKDQGYFKKDMWFHITDDYLTPIVKYTDGKKYYPCNPT